MSQNSAESPLSPESSKLLYSQESPRPKSEYLSESANSPESSESPVPQIFSELPV